MCRPDWTSATSFISPEAIDAINAMARAGGTRHQESMAMGKPFEEALGDLIDEHVKRGTDRDSIISALELTLMAQREEHDANNGTAAG